MSISNCNSQYIVCNEQFLFSNINSTFLSKNDTWFEFHFQFRSKSGNFKMTKLETLFLNGPVLFFVEKA